MGRWWWRLAPGGGVSEFRGHKVPPPEVSDPYLNDNHVISHVVIRLQNFPSFCPKFLFRAWPYYHWLEIDRIYSWINFFFLLTSISIALLFKISITTTSFQLLPGLLVNLGIPTQPSELGAKSTKLRAPRFFVGNFRRLIKAKTGCLLVSLQEQWNDCKCCKLLLVACFYNCVDFFFRISFFFSSTLANFGSLETRTPS